MRFHLKYTSHQYTGNGRDALKRITYKTIPDITADIMICNQPVRMAVTAISSKKITHTLSKYCRTDDMHI